jgi:RNA polymerase sigma-70 factor (ECF subfamily)
MSAHRAAAVVSLREIDDELVDGIRDRSDAAFGTLYQLIASDLLSFAYGMLRDRGAAEDAVQQAFLELARSAPSIRGDGRSLRAWLYRSVRFSCLDEVRRRSRHPEDPSDRLPDAGVVDEPAMPDPDLQDALMDLSDRHRAILVLRYVLDASFDEIAAVMGTNRAAAYASCARAERSLERRLRRVESDRAAASEGVGGGRTDP